ncbi:hypothetical protein RR46_06342 [Papilio xuthus]|uniref:Uncharacterized protein n=1 Tax=Papilio xuthus TaxID=66420 RepID=A0A194QCN8_PAPXU|nr:hypothetical protein RR46_06342 [Papilio xuthus]
MTEKRIGFLYKVATRLATVPQENSQVQHLRSFYLMRCKEITQGYGLPQQQFSVKSRCPHCCLEWTKNTVSKVKSLQLTKRQRKRIKKNKTKKDLLHSNKLEQICSFCKHNTTRTVLKPKSKDKELKKVELRNTKNIKSKNVIENKEDLKATEKNQILNAYITSKDVFSLSNKNNTLSNTIKEKPKIIKNNKRKKDKFAGLCKQAVLASAKLKVEKEKPSNISLFLKPCL